MHKLRIEAHCRPTCNDAGNQMPLLRLQNTSKSTTSNREAREGTIARQNIRAESGNNLPAPFWSSLSRKTVRQQIKDKYKLLSETARRRGFFWGSFEIYGGLSGFLDLGPLGVGLKRQIEDRWREFFLRRHGFIEVSTPIITPHKVLEASGHVENFKDPMTECSNCHRRFRADQLVKEATGLETEGMSLEQLGSLLKERHVKCPECGGELGSPQYFMTMFKTSIGPYGEDPAYGRPEAAQGIFVNFRRIFETMREKFPIGIAQVGTVLRNEISPRQGPLRLREFTIMDFELFFDPEEPDCPYLDEVASDELSIVTEENRKEGTENAISVEVGEAVKKQLIKAPWAAYFMALSKRFLNQLGVEGQHQRFFEELPTERAHYSAQTFDHEVRLDRSRRFRLQNRLRLAKTHGSHRRRLASLQTLSNTPGPSGQIDQGKSPEHQKALSRRNKKSRRSNIQRRPGKTTESQEGRTAGKNRVVHCAPRLFRRSSGGGKGNRHPLSTTRNRAKLRGGTSPLH